MCSGIRISEEQMEEFEKNPGQVQGQGQVRAYLEGSAPITPTAQSFHYQGIDPQLVMQVIDAVVPGSAEDFIKTELLDKMGITDYSWRTDVSGLPSGPSGSSMTSLDMIKRGMLAMNNGMWENEQLISEAFITKSINRIIRTSEDDIFGGGADVSKSGYGYYWSQTDMKVGDKTYFSPSSQGGGGQFIILINELNLIVVVTAHGGEISTLQMMAERILPAFVE